MYCGTIHSYSKPGDSLILHFTYSQHPVPKSSSKNPTIIAIIPLKKQKFFKLLATDL